MTKKRLVVCCDGTWNTPDQVKDGKSSPTNVAKLARAVLTPQDAHGIEQRMYYHKGVGTGRFDHFRGGALGWGLSRNVQDAYMFLVENYDDPDDEIFLFGFSRGAYTARSVAGLLRNSGLLKREYAGKLDTAYELYRDRTNTTHPDPSRPSSSVRVSHGRYISNSSVSGIPLVRSVSRLIYPACI